MELKKQKLATQEAVLNFFPSDDFKRVGSTLFLYTSAGEVLRKRVYEAYRRYGVDLNVLCMKIPYFVGAKTKAEKLQNKFGGLLYPSEYCFLGVEPRDIWIWEGASYNALSKVSKEQLEKLQNCDAEEMELLLF